MARKSNPCISLIRAIGVIRGVLLDQRKTLRFLIALAVASVSLASTPARADGLLYRLPKDGTWARFEMRHTNDNAVVRKTDVFMRSVGRTDDSEGSRWLELKYPQEEGTRTVKLLIPEQRLQEGESPLDHVLRAWVRKGEATESLAKARDFWLLVLLAGPLTQVEELERKAVDSPLGELECPGLTGRAHVREDDRFELDLTYTTRRHEKAPFGVVTCDIDGILLRGGEKKAKFKIEFRLAEVGENAMSEMSGYE